MSSLRRHAWTALQVVLFAFVVAIALIYGESVTRLRSELERLGAWGAVGFVLLQALWMLTTTPSAPLMMLGGIVYGVWLGTLYVLIGGVLGATATFMIGRHTLRTRAVRGSRYAKQLQQVIRLVEDHPIVSIMIVRLAPVFPVNLLNYGFGATRISFRLYLVVSTLMLLPGAAIYTGLGNILSRAALGQRLPVLELASLIVFVAIGIALTWYARRRTKSARQQPGQEGDP